jgi:transposase
VPAEAGKRFDPASFTALTFAAAAIRAVGAKLFFLPKYSPDLNPIEMFFAKLKHWLRKAAQRSADAIY